MIQACFAQTGRPGDVVTLQTVPDAPPGPGEVTVRMLFAPVNPADMNFIEGTYGRKPDLPAVPGMEGVGVVEDVGDNVSSVHPGRYVLPASGPGCWASRITVRAGDLIPLPDGLDPQQAAMLRVNPATAWGMLHLDGGPPPPGSWIVQNAGSSAAAACILQVGRALGLKVMSLVRRAESIDPCLKLGADAALPDSQESASAAVSAFGSNPPLRAFNAVGGDSAIRLAGLLVPGGTMITYGAMSRQALRIPNSFLIFRNLHFRGFWVTRWIESLNATERSALYARLAAMSLDGSLRQPVAAVYPLARIHEALEHAARDRRGGKVLLDLQDG